MAFNGNESNVISISDASEWTANYRGTVSPAETKAHFFGINKLMEILNQTGCKGIRAYYAIDNTGKKQLVLVGANASEADMLDNEIVLDNAIPCPNACDTSSPLYTT